MTILFEFLDREPIENYITCLNFKVDRVVFFGYHDEIEKQKNNAKRFLTEVCGVSSVVFHPVSATDASGTINNLANQVEAEKGPDREVYFDITGGESLVLVAFGIIADRVKAPIHFYDVANNKLHELDTESGKRISEHVPAHTVEMTIDRYLMMHGACIDNSKHKDNKFLSNDNASLIRSLWEVTEEFRDVWNGFSNYAGHVLMDKDSLSVSRSAHTIIEELNKENVKIGDVKSLNRILDTLADKGLIRDLVHANGKYSFRYLNEYVKKYIREAGSVLEVYTCAAECPGADEYQIGVTIDWDGRIDESSDENVTNEVDVVTLKGYTLSFISCKSGKFRNADHTRSALYELETEASRFGGKYAVKKMYLKHKIGDVHEERARELGIELIYV